MYYIKNLIVMALILVLLGTSCKLSKTQKGAGIGAAAGGVIGAVVGRASGNTALGTIIGAAVGGTTGAVIGNKMDKQAEEMKNNIPNAKVERVGEGIIVEFNDKILFGFDKSELTVNAKKNLRNLVVILSKYPDTNIEVQGHTDDVGTDAYNMDLSNRRATAVAYDLIGNGISSTRVTMKGYGETAPKFLNDTESHRAGNRRVEFLITANEKMKAEAKAEAEKNK